MNRKIMAILMAAVFILPIVTVSISFNDGVEAAATDVIVVETSPDFAPYDYYYGTEFVGIDMDILRAIGMDTGYTIKFVQNRFDSIITSVTAGNCDMGASGFTITDERKNSVNFSNPYTTIKQVAVGKSGLNVTSERDLDGKKLVAQMGTSGEYYAAESLKGALNEANKNVTGLNTYSDIVFGLLNNVYDFEIVDEPVAQAQVTANPSLEVYDVLKA
ncbi:MAG: transporter substrate-binding domain-containing protein [Candidatus Methanomethylophilaceae archaeon]|nr:transporter substrate-binding domain-containing protein [Candidatus Methanomethylophilaceae archaeon]